VQEQFAEKLPGRNFDVVLEKQQNYSSMNLRFEKGGVPHFWINTVYTFCIMNIMWLSCLSRDQTANITLKPTLVKVQSAIFFCNFQEQNFSALCGPWNVSPILGLN
jgi:hypothetical protein